MAMLTIKTLEAEKTEEKFEAFFNQIIELVLLWIIARAPEFGASRWQCSSSVEIITRKSSIASFHKTLLQFTTRTINT